MADLPSFPQFRAVADRAVLVEFGEVFSDEVQAKVRQLDRAVQDHPFAGFAECVPAMVNVLVCFDPEITDHHAVIREIRALISVVNSERKEQNTHIISVCYEPEFALDMNEVAAQTGLSVDAVINAHLACTLEVAMYGFAPGYAYLSGLPEVLRLSRKPAALRGVAAGSVIIAGAQCLITTLTMPTGWWIIGRSAAAILTGDAARPFLFDPGDRVGFLRVTADEYHAQIRAQIRGQK